MRKLLMAMTVAAALLMFSGLLRADDKPAAPDKPPAAKDEQLKHIKELWEIGIRWQVGDNVPLVAKARDDLIALGEPALKFAMTRIAANNSLETRCLDVVIIGLAKNKDLTAKVIKALLEHVGDKDVNARRGAARTIGGLEFDKLDKEYLQSIQAALLAQARVEDDPRPRYGQLTVLAKWKVEEALDLVIDLSRTPLERVRPSAVALLSYYDNDKARGRLIELLDDVRYFVRDAAAAELKKGGKSAARLCQHAARELDGKLGTPEEIRRLRLLMEILAANPKAVSPEDPSSTPDSTWKLMVELCANSNANLRADAATALVDLALLPEADPSPVPKDAKDQARKLLNDRKAGEEDIAVLAAIRKGLDRLN